MGAKSLSVSCKARRQGVANSSRLTWTLRSQRSIKLGYKFRITLILRKVSQLM